MHSDLIVMIFDRQVDCQRVYDAIQSMRHSPLLGLDSAVIATRDSAGAISLYQRRVLNGAKKDTGVDEVGQITEMIFGLDLAERDAELVKVGLDERFADRVNQAIGRDDSALLALLAYEDIAEKDELLRVLNLFRGHIFQTTISANKGFEDREEGAKWRGPTT